MRQVIEIRIEEYDDVDSGWDILIDVNNHLVDGAKINKKLYAPPDASAVRQILDKELEKLL